MEKSAYINQSNKELFENLSSSATGLSQEEVVNNQGKFGLNEITVKEKAWFYFLFKQLNSPLILVLLLAALLSFFLADKLDSLIIVIIISLNTFLGFFQEYRSQHELSKLKALVKAEVTVQRDGQLRNIERKQLTIGDILILNPGDIVAADARIIKCENLIVDESVLTGESFEQVKSSNNLPKGNNTLLGASNCVLSGTTVKSGYCEAIVFAISRDTQLGEITKLAVETNRVSTFEQNISRFSSFVVKLVLITLVLTFVAHIFIKGENARIIELIVFTIALAVSVIPEALPAIITLTLSRGALRLARDNIIVKRLTSLEDLGHIQVLCTDKTGTITENKLAVVSIFAKDKSECLKLALLVDETSSVRPDPSKNPFDLAIEKELARQNLQASSGFTQIWKFPFDPIRGRTSSVVEKGRLVKIVTKGAPEAIIESCRLTNIKKQALLTSFHDLGKDGFRVIAVAERETVRKKSYSIKDEVLFKFVGLIAFSDPLKETAKAAISLAEKLNVRIKILTGDSAEVAGQIAYQVGIIQSPKEVVTGAQLERVNHESLKELVETNDCFARLKPEQKFKIIQVLQEEYSVGFLGEGINDAPALKLANASLVVENASDVAREAADIILLKKDLGVIIDGIRAGREIFTNIDKYIKYTLIGNFGNFYAIAGISLIINFLPMLPLQILLANLLTDLPVLSMSADSVDIEDIAQPKKMNIRDIAFIALILGLTSSVFDFIFFAIFKNLQPGNLQTLWFIESILTELVLIYSIRTQKFFLTARIPSIILILLTVSVGTIAFILPYIPFGQLDLHFVAPLQGQLILIGLLVTAYFVVTESVKLVYYRVSKLA